MNSKIFFVAGATGATGRWLTRFLLEGGHTVRVVVRSKERLPKDLLNFPNIMITEANILDLPDSEVSKLLEDCHGVASCLGHNLTFKGIYGKPRRLVRDSVRKLCSTIRSGKVKFVLMNTTGHRNRDLDEKVSFGHKLVIAILRVLLPPQPDNEQAAEYLRVGIGQQHPHIEWVAVRPDGLIDEEEVSGYQIVPSPTRDAIFNAGKISRINVAHFMASLITDEILWEEWKGQMPVIYNRKSDE